MNSKGKLRFRPTECAWLATDFKALYSVGSRFLVCLGAWRQLANKSPTFPERPVDEKSSSSHILVRNRSKITTVAREITVVSQGEVTSVGNGESFFRRRKVWKLVHIGIPAIAVALTHHPLENPLRRLMAIDEQVRRSDAQCVSRNSCQSFDIVL